MQVALSALHRTDSHLEMYMTVCPRLCRACGHACDASDLAPWPYFGYTGSAAWPGAADDARRCRHHDECCIFNQITIEGHPRGALHLPPHAVTKLALSSGPAVCCVLCAAHDGCWMVPAVQHASAGARCGRRCDLGALAGAVCPPVLLSARLGSTLTVVIVFRAAAFVRSLRH